MRTVFLCWVSLMGSWLPTLTLADQIITPFQAKLTVSAEKTFDFTPVYSATTPAKGREAGLGLRIHYNSKALQFKTVSKVFAYGVQPISNVMEDSADEDNDPLNDRYILIAWADVAAQWPGVDVLPLQLLSVQFQPLASFTGTTIIRTSASATADNLPLQTTPMTVTVTTGIKLKMRAFLQGAYVTSSAQMRDDLRFGSLLPATQPYGVLGYTGKETTTASILATTGTTAPVDWVLVELRDASSPTTVIARQAALLQRNGDIAASATNQTELIFTEVPAGNYYVVLRHRNHLAVMTRTPVSLNSNAVTVDFTAMETPLQGPSPTAIQNNTRLLWVGDVNADDKLIFDGPNNDKNSILVPILSAAGNPNSLTNYQLNAYSAADLNMDGKVIFSGPNNELNTMLSNILTYSTNTTVSTNFVVPGVLPKAN